MLVSPLAFRCAACGRQTPILDTGEHGEGSEVARREGWDRFANGPAPVGYDPAIIPMWPNPEVPEFGVLRLTPRRLRVMPGTMMTAGAGELLTWHT